MEQAIYPKLILDALTTVRYPGTGKNIVESSMVEDDIRIDGRKVSFSLIFDRPTDPFIKSIVKAAEAAILTHVGPDVEIKGNIAVKTRQAPKPKPEVPLKGVKNIIAISSGKGGVGKSTVASNLAVALVREGYTVGLLDADIFGPSVPKMFGVEDEQLYIHDVDGVQKIIPVERYGVKMLSIGFMVNRDSGVVWRGGMASRALTQLITEGDWGELDYLLIDMPPGTSDIHLTTPQQVALADARRGIAMFRDQHVNVPILGIIENMAWFTPEQHPDEKYYIFGKEGAMELARELGVRVLGQIPVVLDICQGGDSGQPIATTDSITAHAFAHTAHNLVEAVEERNNTLPPTTVVKMQK